MEQIKTLKHQTLQEINNIYRKEYFTGERALFKEKNAKIYDSDFGEGESPLKHGENLYLNNCSFKWKYPLWYTSHVLVENSTWFEMGRSGVWYAKDLCVKDSIIDAPKNFRRCHNITLNHVSLTRAQETMWYSKDIKLDDVMVVGDYFGMSCENIKASNIHIVGNYAFQGCKNVEIYDSKLISKDAFWDCENVTVYNSYISGEYLAWNTKNLTLINCTIESLQGLDYIEHLVMRECEFIHSSLVFENSTIDCDIKGTIDSILNPEAGYLKVDEIKDIKLDNPEKVTIIFKDKEGYHA